MGSSASAQAERPKVPIESKELGLLRLPHGQHPSGIRLDLHGVAPDGSGFIGSVSKFDAPHERWTLDFAEVP